MIQVVLVGKKRLYGAPGCNPIAQDLFTTIYTRELLAHSTEFLFLKQGAHSLQSLDPQNPQITSFSQAQFPASRGEAW